MCGIVGFLAPEGFDAATAARAIRDMTGTLHHRGPDDSGEWLDPAAGVALGHRRLSIIDLSAAGHQPMASSSGRFVLIFNGEIYNHLEIRDQLQPQDWRGHSDTETLLAGIQRWGLEATLRRAVGMFALALWDRQERMLSLARDRMGEKPLYFGWQGSSFLFASELKALRVHPDFNPCIDHAALCAYVKRGYVPAPQSIFVGIQKLLPGAILDLPHPTPVGNVPAPRAYWSLRAVVNDLEHSRFNGAPAEAVSRLEALLRQAIRGQQIADVPLGAFLSGGTDSSAVVALMQATASAPVRTFTIGFEHERYDEAPHGRAVAAHLGTDHTELYVTADDALRVIPELPAVYDEPFADSSQIPTILVSRLARRHVTVALSGDGGDELFCGYGHYPRTPRTWARLSCLPQSLRNVLPAVLPTGALSEGIAKKSLEEFHSFVNSQWKGYPALVAGDRHPLRPQSVPETVADPAERLMYMDALDYLPNDILVKVDRAAMSVSLETRAPFLDHRVVEFAWQLPSGIKLRDGIGKWPLKEILKKYVPKGIVERPKMGFGVPLDSWLRGPLRHWAEDLLSEARLIRDGLFDVRSVRGEWKLHISHSKDRQYWLWTILMFQAWYDAWLAPAASMPATRGCAVGAGNRG